MRYFDREREISRGCKYRKLFINLLDIINKKFPLPEVEIKSVIRSFLTRMSACIYSSVFIYVAQLSAFRNLDQMEFSSKNFVKKFNLLTDLIPD